MNDSHVSESRVPFFSIIVPVYNTESYLDGCVASVRRQTYENWELLLIDDGSTDDSARLCKLFCAQDERIHFWIQDHKGPAAARNLGMGKACGEYVFLLDSDDTIHPCLLKEMYLQIQAHAPDFLTCDYIHVLEETIAPVSKEKPEWQIVEASDSADFFHRESRVMCAVASKTVRRKLFEQVQFDESLSVTEDIWFVYQLCQLGVRIAYTREKWYYYRMRKDSIMHTKTLDTYMPLVNGERKICRNEYSHGNMCRTRKWEAFMLWEIDKRLGYARQLNDKESLRFLKQTVLLEMITPPRLFFKALTLKQQVYFGLSIFANPVFRVVRRIKRLIVNNS